MSRFLASVNIFAESSQIDYVLVALSKLQNIEEVYEVAGEYDIVTLSFHFNARGISRNLAEANNENKRRKKHHNHYYIASHKGPRCQEKTNITSTT